MNRPSQPPPRDMVYCHQCENEWYRDEHGLTCPDCQSDFTEIIETQNDPRDDDMHIPSDTQLQSQQHQGRGDVNNPAPDPDEEDIGNLRWTPNGPGRMRLQGTMHTTVTPEQLAQLRESQQQGGSGGIMGLLGGFIQNAIGGPPHQPTQQQQQSTAVNRLSSRSPPSSGPGGSSVRTFQGPGYSMTIATSSSGNIFPRNANAPQPFQPQPEGIDQLMAQMFMNIGGMGPGMHPNHLQGNLRRGPQGMYFIDDTSGGMPPGFAGGPLGVGGAGIGPFGNLFQMLGMGMAGPGGAHGDYVFSQEALDRIVTQMMEQQQMGNAPGPASDAAINALLTKKISDADLGENGKAECSICMDEVSKGTSVTALPCGHWFHFECVKAWLSEHDSCPQCRQGIMPKDESTADRPRQPSQAAAVDMHGPEYRHSSVPGAFPFTRQNSSGSGGVGGSRAASSENTDSGGGAAGGMFSRMRDAFGGSGGASNPSSSPRRPSGS